MRNATQSAVVASLAILAVALAAATLDSTMDPTRGGSGGQGQGEGDGTGGVSIPIGSGASPGEAVQIPFVSELLAVLAVVAVIGVIAFLFFYWRAALGIVLAVAVLIGVLYLLFHFLSSPTTPPGSPILEPGNGTPAAGGGGGGSETDPSPPASLAWLLVLGIALVGAVVAYLRRTGDAGGDESLDTAGTDAAAVGRAAGRAADRLEDEADVGNEVYRTWREMTELLDVDAPETSTPGEFAAAAVEAGLGREDVGELTRLFEDVRYGDTRPSAAHERRAIAVFRRIEARYAEEEP